MNLKEKTLTKQQVFEELRNWLEEQVSVSLRKCRSEESFKGSNWSELMAFQLGYQKLAVKLLELIPDREIND